MFTVFVPGLNRASSMEMLTTLRRLCDNGHLVIATMESIPQKAAHLFSQFVLLNDKQVHMKDNFCTLKSLADDIKLSVRPLTLITK